MEYLQSLKQSQVAESVRPQKQEDQHVISEESPLQDLGLWLAATQRRVDLSGATGTATLTRRFAYRIDRVWLAFTDAKQLAKWFGTVTGDLRQGSTVLTDVGAPFLIKSSILCCEPPRHLVITWQYGDTGPTPVDEVEMRLTDQGDQTLMVLQHRSCASGKWWFGAGAGWEFALIKLQVLLQHGDPASLPVDDLDQHLAPLWDSAEST